MENLEPIFIQALKAFYKEQDKDSAEILYMLDLLGISTIKDMKVSDGIICSEFKLTKDGFLHMVTALEDFINSGGKKSIPQQPPPQSEKPVNLAKPVVDKKIVIQPPQVLKQRVQEQDIYREDPPIKEKPKTLIKEEKKIQAYDPYAEPINEDMPEHPNLSQSSQFYINEVARSQEISPIKQVKVSPVLIKRQSEAEHAQETSKMLLATRVKFTATIDENLKSSLDNAIFDQKQEELFNILSTLDLETVKVLLTDFKNYDYKEYLRFLQAYNLFSKDDEFTKKHRAFTVQARMNKYSRCNEYIQSMYDLSPHAGLTLYLQNSNLKELNDPSKPSIFKQLVQVVESLNRVPLNCQDTIESIITMAEAEDLDSAKELLMSVEQEDERFFLQIIPKFEQIFPGLQQEQESKSSFRAYKKDIPDKFLKLSLVTDFNKALETQDYKLASLNLKQLIQSEISVSVSLIKALKSHNLFQGIESLLSSEDLIILEAPDTLRQDVKLLISGLKNPIDKESLFSSLESIALEDSEFYEKFFEKFQDQIKNSGIKLMKPIHEIIDDSLDYMKEALPLTKNLFTIENFLSLEVEFNQQNLENKALMEFSQKGMFDCIDICTLLFYYIKKRLDIIDFINNAKRMIPTFKMSRIRLIEYLLAHSDDNLKTLIITSTSLYSASPLLSLSLYEESMNVWEDHSVVYEGHQSILSFKLPERGHKGPKGCSSLTNLLMSRNFELHSESYSNFATVEIQYDYNFAEQIHIPVADIHGFIEQDQILKLSMLFTMFIIHVRNYKKNQANYDQVIQEISKRQSSRLIVIIDHNSDANSQVIQKEKPYKNTYVFSVKPIDKLDDTHYKILHEELHSTFFPDIKELRAQKKSYVSNPFERIGKCQKYIQFVESFNKSCNKSKRTIQLVEEFMNYINDNDQDLHSERFLPFNSCFGEISSLYIQMNQISGTDSETYESLLQQQTFLEEKIRNTEPSQVISYIEKIISAQVFLPAAMMIQKLLKGHIGKHIDDMNTKRLGKRDQKEKLLKQMEIQYPVKNNQDKEEVKENFQMQQLQVKSQQQFKDQQDIENLSKEISKIDEEIDKKSFSLEYVIRELYLSGCYKDQTHPRLKSDYIELTKEQISTGQPFEIIDGNNLSFISGVYDKMGNDITDKDVIVVSVVGPQSAGKSLLLNFLFGTQFQSAAGRCTKGVYASLIDVKINGKKKKILILDTEGIQSAEARDDKFDKRIVFYIICVSHVVLICNKSDMNKEMSEVIRLAADCISKINETKIKGASVFIIMNMVAEASNSILNECIQKLTTDLNTINSEKSESRQSSPFVFSTDNVMVLPWAFDKSQKSGKFKANVPSPDFIESLEPLRNKILEKCGHADPDISVIKLSEWFKHADQTWTLAHKMKGLTEYKTLEDKRKEKELSDRVVSLIKEEYEDKKIQIYEQLDLIRNTIIDQDKEKQMSLDQFIQLCKMEVDKYHLKLHEQTEKQFDQIITMMGVKQLKKNVESYFLERQEFYKQTWNKYQRQLIAEKFNERAYWVGDERINQSLKVLMREGIKYSKEQALQQFTNVWTTVENEVQSKLSQQNKQIKLNAHTDISRTYKQFLPSTGIVITDFEIESIKKYQENQYSLRSLIEIEQIIKQKGARVFYFSQDINPSLDEICKIQGQSRIYIKQIPVIYEHYRTITKFSWGKMIEKHFKLDMLRAEFEGRFNQSFLNNFIDDTFEQIQALFEILIKQINYDIGDYQVSINEELLIQFFDHLRVQVGGNKPIQTVFKMRVTKTMFNSAIDRLFRNLSSNKKFYFKYQKKIGINYQAKNNDPYNDGQSKYFAVSSFNMNNFIKDFKNHPIIEIDGEQIIKYYDNYMIKQSFLQSAFAKKNKQNLQQAIVKYFQDIMNTKSIQHFASNPIGQLTLDYFFELVDFDKVFQKLEYEIIRKVKISGQVLSSESINYWVQQLSDFDSSERKQLNKISDEVIKLSVREVNIMINQLNDDLKPFGVKFSEYGIGFMNLAVLTMLKALAEQQYIMENNKPLESLKKMKKDQQNLFVAKLTSDDVATDDQIAKKIVDQSIQLVVDTLRKQVKSNFDDICEQSKTRFAKAQLVVDIENSALQYAAGEKDKNEFKEDQIIDFFMDPRNFLETYFTQKWDNIIGDQVTHFMDNFQEMVCEKIEKLRGFFVKMRNLFERETGLSIEYFVKKDVFDIIKQSYSNNIGANMHNQPQNQDQNQNITDNEQAKLCASQYIIKCLRNNKMLKEQQDTVFIVDGNEYVENTFFKILPRIELNDDISVDEEIIQQIENILKKEGISKIINFVNSCIKHFKNYPIKDLKITQNEIISNNRTILNGVFLGCEEFCPLCRRQCDKNHENHENLAGRKHGCTQGHQILGFGGNSDTFSKFAITLTCSDFKGTDQVFFNNQNMDWDTFKTQASDKQWEFESKNQAYLRDKNYKIWNAFGQKICKKYSSEKGDKKVQIRFKKVDQNINGVNHYIIMLDDSSSMKGQRWNYLQQAVKGLILGFENADQNVKRNSVLSCIIYNSQARVVFQNQKNFQITSSLMEKIVYEGGTTEFEPPLEEAMIIMEEYKQETTQYILCLMTDGEASFPQKIVDRLKASPFSNQYTFRAIFFGDQEETKVIKTIAKALGGSVETAINLEQLKSAFINLNPNLYKV